ncbi:MAG: Mobile element protein, partial [uncultured Nocardioides sp.]
AGHPGRRRRVVDPQAAEGVVPPGHPRTPPDRPSAVCGGDGGLRLRRLHPLRRRPGRRPRRRLRLPRRHPPPRPQPSLPGGVDGRGRGHRDERRRRPRGPRPRRRRLRGRGVLAGVPHRLEEARTRWGAAGDLRPARRPRRRAQTLLSGPRASTVPGALRPQPAGPGAHVPHRHGRRGVPHHLSQPDAGTVAATWDEVRDQLAKSFPKIGPL